MTDPEGAARALIETTQGQSKPVLACWMGGRQVESGRRLLAESKIPSFPTPETAVEAFAYLANYRQNQKLLLEVPGPLADRSEPDVEGARLIIEEALHSGRDTLSTTESKALLTAFRIPVVPAIKAATPGDALVAAEQVGFPIAMKIDSGDITHKSDVGGVRLGIASAAEVRGAFVAMIERVKAARPEAKVDGVTVERMYRRSTARELLVGVVRDAAFGPVVTFGSGGTAVEVTGDSAVALPPLNRYIARDLIRRTRVSRLLAAFRDLPPVRMEAVEQALLRISEMVCELPHIRELDINPLLADETGVTAVDARIVVEAPTLSLQRYAHMAIHPYPTGLESRIHTADGGTVEFRPIRPEDADIEQAFIRRLSPEAKYFRFMRSLTELTPEMLIRFTQIDYDREMAFIATTVEDGAEKQIGVVRYATEAGRETCEFALVVGDEWQRKGIGSGLMKRLMGVARERGLKTMRGEVLSNNAAMLRLMKGLGFSRHTSPEDPELQIVQRDLREEL
jgi:acetyltransferase